MAVVTHHTLEEASAGRAGPTSPDWLITFGAAGVDVFFVISGFIMIYVSFNAAGKAQSPHVFLVRRLSRIYPVYWLCLFAIFFARMTGLFSSIDISPKSLVLAITLLPGHSIVYVAWTLTFELYFYLIFAGTLFFRSRLTSLLGCLASIVAFLVCSTAMPVSTIQTFFNNPIALEFCIGLAVGWLFVKYGDFQISTGLIAMGALALLLATLLIDHPNTGGLSPWHRTLAWGIPSALVVAGAANISVSKSRAAKYAALLGDASYSVYLTHIFVMIVYARLLKTTGLGGISQWAIIPLVLAASAITGILLHLLAEKPMIGLLRRKSRLPKAAAVYSPEQPNAT